MKIVLFVQKNNNTITEFFVLRHVMPVIWKKGLSIKHVYANMKKRGFKKMSNTDMKTVGVRVTEILKMSNI